jgi:hypothetical protein
MTINSRATSSQAGLIGTLADSAMERFRIVTEGSDARHVKLPTAVDVRPVGITVDGADAAQDVISIAVLGKGETKIVKLNGTCAKGDRIVAEDPATDALGKARALPVAAGAYWVIGTAMEAGADEQEIAIEDCEPYRVVVQATIADVAASTQVALTGTLTGTLDNSLADVGGSWDATAIATINKNFKEIQAELTAALADNNALVAKINAVLVALETASVVKSA